MCSDVLSYQLLGVWQAWSHGPFSFLRRFNLRKQLRKSVTKFLFSPTWVFGLYIDSIFILCWDCSKQHQKTRRSKAWAQRTLTVLIIFSITSDDKPDLQRSLHELPDYAMCWTCRMPLVELNQLLKCSPPLSWKVPQLKQGELLSYV